ncbi:MAG: DNA topoisomerase 4 subunit A [Clostridia bacterium]|nr:DNA topoisomerase 4 subunit A [Clostridia bacterium]
MEQLEMSEVTRIIEQPLEDIMHSSMLPFAEYVILDRALPRVEDGLKPVQRRILYSMMELGLSPDKPTRKCARIVGDCLGKYHPHGDSSVYDALVRLAQPFNMNKPLVEGQGNFGSIDGDSAAAMRYTEAKMSPMALELLRDIDKETVPFSLNFDDTLPEPDMLPGRFPNLLVNGTNGIAIGLATNIPPHNLGEVVDGIVAMIENPKISLDEMMTIIKAPDFPTGGIIVCGEELRTAYETGKGKITIRARVKIEKDGDKKSIVVTEIPYQVNKTALLLKVAEYRETKKDLFADIADIIDESDKQGLRVVFKLKRGADANRMISTLMKQTDLSKTFGINMVAIAGGKPKLMGILEIMSYYIEYQRTIILRRTNYDLAAAKERVEILSGLLIAIQNIDDVIRIIKKAANVTEAKLNLRNRFALTERQAHAIVEMKLRRLTHLETVDLQSEIDTLHRKIEEYTAIVNSKRRQLCIVREELKEIKRKYKNERISTPVFSAEQIDIKEDDGTKPVTNGAVVLTDDGCIKFVNNRSFSQGSRQTESLDTYSVVRDSVMTATDKVLYGFTDKGNYIRYGIDGMVEKKWKDKGVTLLKLIPSADPEETLVSIMAIDENRIGDDDILCMFTDKGMIKFTSFKEYKINKNYSPAISMKNEDEHVIAVDILSPYSTVTMVTQKGMCINMSIDDVPVQGRRSGGVKGIQLADDDKVVFAGLSDGEGELVLINSKGQGKRIILAELDESKRCKKGVKLIDDVMFADIVKMPYMIAFTEVKDYLPEGSPDRECFECLSTEMVPITEPNDEPELVISSSLLKPLRIVRNKV